MNPNEPTYDQLKAERDALQSENEKLREALEWKSVADGMPDTRRNVLCLTRLMNGKAECFVGVYTKGGEIEYYNHDDEPDFLAAGWYELEEQHHGDYDEHWFEREVTHWREVELPAKAALSKPDAKP